MRVASAVTGRCKLGSAYFFVVPITMYFDLYCVVELYLQVVLYVDLKLAFVRNRREVKN